MNKRNNCVFTIVAQNYIGPAQVLNASIKQYYQNLDFFIVVADEPSLSPSEMPSNVIIARDNLDFDVDIWEEMAFKYNLTEFCTAIKPSSVEFFLDKGYRKVIYVDPDILFFSSIEPIFQDLDHHKLVLTPHICSIPQFGKTDAPETDWTKCGIYNLGFLAVSESDLTRSILSWWQERLNYYCFMDSSRGEYTDQKWMDFLPAFCTGDELLISKDLGRNLAPWNFFEREVHNVNGEYFVNERNSDDKQLFKLLFAHFSGYNYKDMLKGNVSQKNILDLKDYIDIRPLLIKYANNITENRELFEKYIDCEYSYDRFEDGHKISKFDRLIFESLLENGYKFKTPFRTDGELYKLFKRNKLLENGSDSYSSDTNKSINNKIKKANKFLRIVFKIVGKKKYSQLVRAFSLYRSPRNHFHILRK